MTKPDGRVMLQRYNFVPAAGREASISTLDGIDIFWENVSRQSDIRILLKQFNPLKEGWSCANFPNNNRRVRLT